MHTPHAKQSGLQPTLLYVSNKQHAESAQTGHGNSSKEKIKNCYLAESKQAAPESASGMRHKKLSSTSYFSRCCRKGKERYAPA
jgi:hypothetical protein